MWQRFTERARKIVFYAQEEAQKFGEGYVSTEHLLLGIIRETDNVACHVLENLGVSHNRVRAEVEKQLPRNEGRSTTDMTLTPRAKRVIDLAYDEARNLNNNYIGSEHLLLGLIREEAGLAGRVLAKLGIDLESGRRMVLELQDQSQTTRSENPPPRPEFASRPGPGGASPLPIALALLAIRQGRLSLDFASLLILAHSTPRITEVLKRLELAPEGFLEAVETEFLQGPTYPLPGGPSLELDDEMDPLLFFRQAALHPSSFTRRALETLGKTSEQIAAAFEEPES